MRSVGINTCILYNTCLLYISFLNKIEIFVSVVFWLHSLSSLSQRSLHAMASISVEMTGVLAPRSFTDHLESCGSEKEVGMHLQPAIGINCIPRTRRCHRTMPPISQAPCQVDNLTYNSPMLPRCLHIQPIR